MHWQRSLAEAVAALRNLNAPLSDLDQAALNEVCHFVDAATAAPLPDNGPWRAAHTDDGRTFVESDGPEDVRLYLDGDFGWAERRLAYAQDIARRLNATATA